MKKKPEVKTRRPSSGYRISRNEDGLTERQRLDRRRADLLELEIAEKRGTLVKRSDVEAGMRECAEVLQSDLFGALPSRCSTELAGQKLPPEKVRSVVLDIVDAMVKNWTDAGIVTPCTPSTHSQK